MAPILLAPIIIVVLAGFCFLWLALVAYLSWSLEQLPRFEHEIAPEPEVWPSLSVIVPACNEAAHVASAARTILAQDYPGLELILVDDRSDDGTGAVIDRLAEQDGRVQALHIDKLPQQWLGKVHALQCGVEHANGKWLLFTDADVHFAPTTLRHAIAYATDQQADHLTLIPRTIQSGFWLDVAVRAFGLLFLLGTRVASINRPGNNAFVGIGAFNLVNAATFHRTAGLEWLKLEPADDVGLGMMINRAGGITRLALAEQDLSIEWYSSLAAMFSGLEKNLFGAACDYRHWRLVAHLIAIVSLVTAPWLLIGVGAIKGSVGLTLIGSVTIVAPILCALASSTERRRGAYSLLLFPAGLLLIAAMLWHAGYTCLKNDGIAWRGTHYPLAQLRAGQRVKWTAIVNRK